MKLIGHECRGMTYGAVGDSVAEGVVVGGGQAGKKSESGGGVLHLDF